MGASITDFNICGDIGNLVVGVNGTGRCVDIDVRAAANIRNWEGLVSPSRPWWSITAAGVESGSGIVVTSRKVVALGEVVVSGMVISSGLVIASSDGRGLGVRTMSGITGAFSDRIVSRKGSIEAWVLLVSKATGVVDVGFLAGDA